MSIKITDSPLFNGNVPSIEMFIDDIKNYEKMLISIAFKNYNEELNSKSNYNWHALYSWFRGLFNWK